MTSVCAIAAGATYRVSEVDEAYLWSYKDSQYDTHFDYAQQLPKLGGTSEIRF